MTIIAIEQADGSWSQVDSEFNRRVHGNTRSTVVLVGEDHRRSRPTARPAARPTTARWVTRGTHLGLGEEKLERLLRHDQRHVDRHRGAEALWRRQGRGFGYNWVPGRPCFDIAANPNEIHRFGLECRDRPAAPNS